MSKRLTPYEKVDNFITKERDKQCDRWNAGLSNNVDEWDNFIEYWNLIDDIASLKKDNAELRVYNGNLLEENKKLIKMLDDNLIFKNGHLTSGFSYKGKDIVAMPLEEYDRLMKVEQCLDSLIKFFNIKCSVEYTLNDGIWARFVSIQSKQDEGTWDTTACANLVNNEEDFNNIEEVVKNDIK